MGGRGSWFLSRGVTIRARSHTHLVFIVYSFLERARGPEQLIPRDLKRYLVCHLVVGTWYMVVDFGMSEAPDAEPRELAKVGLKSTCLRGASDWPVPLLP